MTKMFLNAMDIPMPEIKITNGQVEYSLDGDTVLERNYDVKKGRGIVRSAGEYALDENALTGKDYVVIEDEVFSAGGKDFGKYLGMKVDYFYTEDDGDLTVVAMEKSKQSEVYDFKLYEMERYENRKVYYITEKGKEKNIKLSEDVYILYNGSVITKFSEELFFGDNGNIKFICNDGDLCDVVIINEYDDYFVDSIDLKNSVIYDKYNKDSKTKQARSLDLSELDEEDIVMANGKVSGIDTVNKGLDEEKSVSLSNIYEKTASVRYIAGSAGFGNRLPVTSKTVFFKVPDESTAKTRGSYSDDKYKVMSVSELKTDTRGYAIIDCLLNLPLLYWASDTYEDNRFALFAKAHADTAVKEFIKPDGSVYHIVNFDTQTGEVKEYPRGQGYESGSSWSRGQAWGVYGFMMSYIHTKDKKYLDASRGIADYIIKNIRERTIVPSDYMQPDSPEIVDASASAITACGMLELAKYSENGEKYEEFAMRLLRGLYDDCDFSDKNQAIIQSATEMYHGNGTNHHIPIIYSEYFLIEALMKCIGKTDYFMW